MRFLLATGVGIVGTGCSDAVADVLGTRDRTWFLTVVGAQWSETRLPTFPYNLVTGRLRADGTYFVSGAVSRAIIPQFDIPVPATGWTLPGNSLEAEVQLVKHWGFQDHIEGTAALVLRSGEIPVFEGLSFNVAWGNGLSYAFSNPAYEFGPDGLRGIGSRRLQYYMGFETEWTHTSLPKIHLVTKLHHRSGIYGIISPQRTGSNYLGAGIRVDID
ncbi:hypothetical protein [Microvirga pakistanensis]|uniref:hypothetical protein n=1 Tax=Microvirga pakistanensis TaxID=1682650 RepID=UPI00195A05BB|nr:hypothetical protein [Microvirga pakistanensis]